MSPRVQSDFASPHSETGSAGVSKRAVIGRSHWPIRGCRISGLLLLVGLLGLVAGCHVAGPPRSPAPRASQFIAVTNFSEFRQVGEGPSGHCVFLSPPFETPAPWNELVVSWNAAPARPAGLKIEALLPTTTGPDRAYTLGLWSPDPTRHPRHSVNGQRDACGEVQTDTLVLRRPARRFRLRLTVQPFEGHPVPDQLPLKFLGLSLADRTTAPRRLPVWTNAWGTILDVPQRSQLSHAEGSGWCSPTAVSMVLAYWAHVLGRPDLDVPVPEVARGVHDPNWPGTGNWPFNTAFAGALPGMRAYVTRLEAVEEIERWVAAGVPVIVSVVPGVLNSGAAGASTGHLIVCVGFTAEGAPVLNDPWADPRTGQSVRRVRPRVRLEQAWQRSGRTVYLIHPETWTVPDDPLGHWR
ncbi:MAG TPA: peptidase C39 family protein [Methylomirabilota bacterium]|nr:peptidase C39 family protein [Methylomirabilota bacterium]